jgi:hypothetical protein
MMTVAVVVGALAIVMTSVNFDMDRAPNGPTSAVLMLDLNRLMTWAVVVIPILLLLIFWKFQAKRLPPERFTVRRLTVGVALCGLAFLLVSRPFAVAGMTPNLIDPPGGSATEVIARMLVFSLGPLAGVIWQRRRGGRGVLGGLFAGIILFGGLSRFLSYRVPNDRFSYGVMGDLFVFSSVGAVNGLTLGFAAWSLLGISGWLLAKRGTSRL